MNPKEELEALVDKLGSYFRLYGSDDKSLREYVEKLEKQLRDGLQNDHALKLVAKDECAHDFDNGNEGGYCIECGTHVSDTPEVDNYNEGER